MKENSAINYMVNLLLVTFMKENIIVKKNSIDDQLPELGKFVSPSNQILAFFLKGKYHYQATSFQVCENKNKDKWNLIVTCVIVVPRILKNRFYIFLFYFFMKNQIIFYYKQKGSFINLQLLKKYRPRSPQPRSPTSIMKLGLVGGHLWDCDPDPPSNQRTQLGFYRLLRPYKSKITFNK